MDIVIRRFRFSLFFFFVVCLSVSAQEVKDEPFNPKWLQNDLDGVKFLVGLTPVENHPIPELKKHFKAVTENTSWFDETNLGFGARRVRLSMGLGYTTIYIDYLLFNDRIVHYTIGADVSKKVAITEHGTAIKRVWKNNGGPSFVEKNHELTYDKDYPDVWNAYSDFLATRLGNKKVITIPEELRASYTLLTDAFENSRISTVYCDDGKPAMEALERAVRIDLIENVLRGFNPGGRIYSAIALLRMKGKGKKISSETQRTINRILMSDAEASTCHGDTGVTGLRANDIVWEFVRDKDW